jgi:CheY-like chemotaxis protein
VHSLTSTSTKRSRVENKVRHPRRAEWLQSLGQMAGGVAHDVNQTLTLIAGHAELGLRALGEEPLDLARAREALLAIGRAANASAEVTRRLLAPGRSGEAADPEPIDLTELFREVVSFTAPRWRSGAAGEGRAIAVSIEVEGAPFVIGQAAELREALTNLIFNAVDAMPRGGTIRLGARRVGEWVEVELSDTGVGMSPEIAERIFEPFFTTKGDQGTGLGLAQVAQTVTRHGGQVSVSSAPGRGTAFRLSLPTGPAVRSRPPAPLLTGRPAQETPCLRVMVVDDEPAVAETLALLLEDEGHRVTVALSAGEALDLLEALPIDLVISDQLLGDGLTGVELAVEVRSRWPLTRAALLTAWSTPLSRPYVDAVGLEAVLDKPYRLEQIRALVGKVADQLDKGADRPRSAAQPQPPSPERDDGPVTSAASWTDASIVTAPA